MMTTEFSSNVRRLLQLALDEDCPSGDITTESIGGMVENHQGVFKTKSPCVVCGLPVLHLLAELLDSELNFKATVKDGVWVEQGTTLAVVTGPLERILIFERPALNLLQHLSGISTHVQRLVAQASPLRLFDTRKTTPGYRELEKYAVRLGGGRNHRFSLSDEILLKDNHIDGSRLSAAELVKRARKNAPKSVQLIVEIRTLSELPEVLQELPDVVLLDNMAGETLESAVRTVKKFGSDIEIELSGNITVERFSELRDLAERYGISPRVSMGNLTYGAPWVDISLSLQGAP